MDAVSRRKLLQLIGAGAVVGCGGGNTPGAAAGTDGGPDSNPNNEAFPTDAAAPDNPDADGIEADDAGGDDGASSDAARVDAGPVTVEDMLNGVETFVIVMMENRPFDQFLGSLKRDATYVNAKTVDGTTGSETNPAPDGSKVKIYEATTYTLADPSHDWADSHEQWDNGKNDKFVIDHAGANQDQAMAYYQRSQIPFYYWLADNFAICDQWHASVMGPTWPNRYYLHAGTSDGLEGNTALTQKPFPTTIWDRIKTGGKSGKNYHNGKSTFYAGAFVNAIKDGGLNPSVPMSQFFTDAKDGKLPDVSIIDPDWDLSDDHPMHDITLGQAFVASIYTALAASPQWDKCLLVIVYDEHGGFYDHVPPPVAPDNITAFERFGFRVPAIIVGPTIKKGYLSKVLYDHTSVLKTISTRYKFPVSGKRTEGANVLLDVFDVTLSGKPRAAPPIPATLKPKIKKALPPVAEGQEELSTMIRSGGIPASWTDTRSDDARFGDWLANAQRLGAIKVE